MATDASLSEHTGPAQGGLNVSEFWQQHDRALDQHQGGGGAALSHDLYRGMPPWFNAYYAYFQQRALQGLLRHCVVPPRGRVLDVGCGTGRWSGLMASRGFQVCGMDVGRQALQYAARRWPDAFFCQVQLPELCFAPETFDLAISVTVLQHVPYDQQPSALCALARVLKPGSHLLLCETMDASDPSPHIFGHGADEWFAFARGAGLQPVAQAGCEYLPQVKLFQWGRSAWQKMSHSKNAGGSVSDVALALHEHPLLAWLVRLALTVSYPLECAASYLPWRWAHLGCFLLRRP
jgi:ubiquinone/menaquinone biosynthesis C-methylase UbiE